MNRLIGHYHALRACIELLAKWDDQLTIIGQQLRSAALALEKLILFCDRPWQSKASFSPFPTADEGTFSAGDILQLESEITRNILRPNLKFLENFDPDGPNSPSIVLHALCSVPGAYQSFMGKEQRKVEQLIRDASLRFQSVVSDDTQFGLTALDRIIRACEMGINDCALFGFSADGAQRSATGEMAEKCPSGGEQLLYLWNLLPALNSCVLSATTLKARANLASKKLLLNLDDGSTSLTEGKVSDLDLSSSARSRNVLSNEEKATASSISKLHILPADHAEWPTHLERVAAAHECIRQIRLLTKQLTEQLEQHCAWKRM